MGPELRLDVSRFFFFGERGVHPGIVVSMNDRASFSQHPLYMTYPLASGIFGSNEIKSEFHISVK